MHRPDLIVQSEATRRVITAIRDAGGRPYLVGGSVRDALLDPGLAPKDVDIETFGLTIDQLTACLSAVGRVDEVGRDFSVLKMRVDDEDFDLIAEPAASLKAAAARRDFTINALMFDPVTEDVVDFFGGIRDLADGLLRHTTAAFADDPLRVLRGVQLATRFSFAMHPSTIDLCQSLVGTYPDLPIERVWEEWLKIGVKGRDITAGLALLQQIGWEAHYPQLAALHGLEQEPALASRRRCPRPCGPVGRQGCRPG